MTAVETGMAEGSHHRGWATVADMASRAVAWLTPRPPRVMPDNLGVHSEHFRGGEPRVSGHEVGVFPAGWLGASQVRVEPAEA